MSNIEQYLADILAARYGEEVRQSIHDAIKQCYEDGRAGAIDLEARADIAAETTAREALDTRVNGIDTRVETLENDTTTAEEVTYDDTSTQLGATNVQGAIGALNNNLAKLFSGGLFNGNIDNIKNTSFIWVNFSTVAGTLPQNTGFGIICAFRINPTVFVQVGFNYYSTSGTPIIYYRMYTNDQWYKWTKFVGTMLNS